MDVDSDSLIDCAISSRLTSPVLEFVQRVEDNVDLRCNIAGRNIVSPAVYGLGADRTFLWSEGPDVTECPSG